MFTGQTAYCNAGARATQTVNVAYPGVRLDAEEREARRLQVQARRGEEEEAQVKAESAIAKAKVKPGHFEDRLLKPNKAFAKKLAPAKKILVKETATIAGSRGPASAS